MYTISNLLLSSVIINEGMTYKIWYYDIMISPEAVSDFMKSSKSSSLMTLCY